MRNSILSWALAVSQILAVTFLLGTTTQSPAAGQSQLAERKLVEGGAPSVVLLVSSDLVRSIRPGLDQLATDIGKDGYTVYEKSFRSPTPLEVRSYLANLYERTEKKLAGAILIGDLPRAYQSVKMTSSNPKFPSKTYEVLSFQYYADLDGGFRSSPDYSSQGRHRFSYDIHEGNLNWEIWVGVLPGYKDDFALTVKALNAYFAKNHAYREGTSKLPRGFLEISEHFKPADAESHASTLKNIRDGQYSWTPFSTAETARIYFDSASQGLTVAQGYADLSEGVADFTVTGTHGNWRSSGQINIEWVEKYPLRTAFFWTNGCAAGDLDHADNFLTAVLYSPKSMAVVAKGTTNDSGGMGTNKSGFFGHNVATSMSSGTSFGKAILDHVNVPLIYPWSEDREFHFATAVILGDPTLRLRRKD